MISVIPRPRANTVEVVMQNPLQTFKIVLCHVFDLLVVIQSESNLLLIVLVLPLHKSGIIQILLRLQSLFVLHHNGRLVFLDSLSDLVDFLKVLLVCPVRIETVNVQFSGVGVFGLAVNHSDAQLKEELADKVLVEVAVEEFTRQRQFRDFRLILQQFSDIELAGVNTVNPLSDQTDHLLLVFQNQLFSLSESLLDTLLGNVVQLLVEPFNINFTFLKVLKLEHRKILEPFAQSLEIYSSVFVNVTVHVLNGLFECLNQKREGTFIKMQIWQVWKEIISQHVHDQNEVVNDSFEIVVKRHLVLQFLEFQLQIFSH
ncbi:hypothetical protein OGAPHI_002111 [Ogataea philodendri]|uniref:Uncharacterized protein n=1 Tax=Ogataea philodendri TaxID=1378263 RepID=A0A9P8PAD2_9ASCO|nr:uncharacterized protein OGAPHI_002111 [Ogataea philodendri]KAH3668357.1 hypothetical protein OGAPHI_002111 [Ogataea philodendri]